MPLIHDVFTKVSYVKDGEEKTKWYKVGIFKITDKGGKYIRFFHQPETTFHVFENDVPNEEKIQSNL